MRRPVPYNPNEPYRLRTAIERAELKKKNAEEQLQRLHLRRDINDVNEKLGILETCRMMYPASSPLRAPEEP